MGPMGLKYEKLIPLSLKGHAALDERWVQDRIAEDPQILGLGDVIVAEEITSRFLNVISLFNGTIPLVAVQMRAVQSGEAVALLFTTVLDHVRLGLVDDDEQVREVADRAYWEARSSKASLAIADELLNLVRAIDPSLALNYNKFYIGLARQGRPDNFVVFHPKKNFLRVAPRLDRDMALEQSIEAAGLDVMEYSEREGRYRIRLSKTDVKKHVDLLTDLLSSSWRAYGTSTEH
jgi:hypothetical protein